MEKTTSCFRGIAVALGRGVNLLLVLVWFAVGFRVLGSPVPHDKRQGWTSMVSEEFSTYGCRPIIFVFCRETIAPGNMGITVGPRLSNGLKTYFGVTTVATQGVDYFALPITNFIKGGGPPVGIWEMQALLTRATMMCPYSRVVAAGYSQGAAITHRAIEALPQYVKDRIAGVVTFGDTQTLQDSGRIKGYALNRTLIICNLGDVICTGTLWVVPIHFDYNRRVPEGIAFLITRILAAQVPPWPVWPSSGIPSGGARPTSTESETLTRPLTSFTTEIPPKTTLPPVPTPTKPLRPSGARPSGPPFSGGPRPTYVTGGRRTRTSTAASELTSTVSWSWSGMRSTTTTTTATGTADVSAIITPPAVISTTTAIVTTTTASAASR